MRLRTIVPAMMSLTCLIACQPPMPIGQYAPPVLFRGFQSQNSQTVIDDSGITPTRQIHIAPMLKQEAIRQTSAGFVFRAVSLKAPRHIASQDIPQVFGSFMYFDHQGNLLPAVNATVTLYQGQRKIAQSLTDGQGKWQTQLRSAGEYRVVFTLENPRWKLDKYSWEGPTLQVEGITDAGTYTLEKGTQNAEAGYIHEIYNRSLQLFERENITLEWWKSQIATEWPADGNYYSWGTVHLTGAQQWDVNGHEIGHAIYHQALNASSRGGYHKIDECYDGTLAFSEGFATFFSGAVQLGKNDPDARFGPYLVPRRAPIQVENVPEDVCPGSRNEWRVSGVLWDLYDVHEDGRDTLGLPLKEMWTTFSQTDKPAIKNAVDAYRLLKERLHGELLERLDTVFQQNTIEIKP